jgi:hypothetical protein
MKTSPSQIPHRVFSSARCRNLFALAPIWLATALIVGCAAAEVSEHVFIKQEYPARSKHDAVKIFTNGLPARQFERAAIIDVQCESQFFNDPTIGKAIPLFIKEARAAGCDAVIEIQETKAPYHNWTVETRVKHYTGIGVVYK